MQVIPPASSVPEHPGGLQSPASEHAAALCATHFGANSHAPGSTQYSVDAHAGVQLLVLPLEPPEDVDAPDDVDPLDGVDSESLQAARSNSEATRNILMRG